MTANVGTGPQKGQGTLYTVLNVEELTVILNEFKTFYFKILSILLLPYLIILH